MKGFISKDKRQINLPVPLGADVYMVNTGCSDVCLFQKEKTEIFRALIKCDVKAICHTIAHKPYRFELTFNNIESTLQNWNDTIFETEEEAKDRTEQLVKEHIAEMKKREFKLRDDGYSVVPDENKFLLRSPNK